MTAVMMKADTRPARRGSRAGVWCSTVAGRQTPMVTPTRQFCFRSRAEFQLPKRVKSAGGAKYNPSKGVQSIHHVSLERNVEHRRALLL